jgi:peptidoglycan pentaglycine glycine transferase (the first glycine)
MGRVARRRDAPPVRDVGGYSVRVSDEANDPAWDDFLEQIPGSDYVQSSRWGRARASIGWPPVRVVVSEDGRVVAGAQMLTRALPVGGRVGLVRKGPVVRDDRPDLVGLVLDRMIAMGSAHHVRLLVVQPPRGREWMCGEMRQRGFRPGRLDVLDTQRTAALRVDLRADLEELLARMSGKCRQQIRLAERRGVTVRRGSEADLSIFDRLKCAHSARLGYDRRSESYYAELWRAFPLRGRAELFIAEYEGEPVSVLFAIPFGDTCNHVERLWSGRHGGLHANVLLEWEVMKWAKSEGYAFTDFAATELPVAAAVLAGRPDSIDPRYGASIFKLRLGAQIVVDPPFLDYVHNPVLRLAYRSAPERILRSRWVDGLIARFSRTGS